MCVPEASYPELAPQRSRVGFRLAVAPPGVMGRCRPPWQALLSKESVGSWWVAHSDIWRSRVRGLVAGGARPAYLKALVAVNVGSFPCQSQWLELAQLPGPQPVQRIHLADRDLRVN